MKFVVLFAVVYKLAYGANHMCWSVAQFAAEVVKQTDKNLDGVLEYGALTAELLDKWNFSICRGCGTHLTSTGRVFQVHPDSHQNGGRGHGCSKIVS